MTNTQQGSRIPGFYNLDINERLDALSPQLTEAEIELLRRGIGLTPADAEHMVENVISVFPLPLGIALNFIVNDREILVPMAVEEPSVVAGASFMAKLARLEGGFVADVDPPLMIGQMQILDVIDHDTACRNVFEHREELLAEVENLDPLLKQLGGGPRDIEIRVVEESPIGPFLVLHLLYDVRDAMGANAVNTAVEHLAPMVESLTGGRVHLRILSNLADHRLARASCTIPISALEFGQFSGEDVAEGIIAAWAFAQADPYRAATHNKGIMNGIDAVVLATGNDWRAVEAGAHAYAARTGRYSSLSTWQMDAQHQLVGKLEMPMAVGIVGGATRVHPLARIALKLMGVSTAAHLAEILVSVGLAQNLAALRALATEGIQRGHMSLHARQVAIAAGAQGEQIDSIAKQMVEIGAVRIDQAQKILAEYSAGNKPMKVH
jgi:hydroxymethylglutaryl-CoA reductase